MKFNKTYREYLHGVPDESPHVEYGFFKKTLEACENSRKFGLHLGEDVCGDNCTWCDQIFSVQLMKQMSEVSAYFSKEVKHILNCHGSSFIYRRVRGCLQAPEKSMDLMKYAVMNSAAVTKLQHKYDKVHTSNKGKLFTLKVHTSNKGKLFTLKALSKHFGLYQSPWMIELLAFKLNSGSDEALEFSCELSATPPIITVLLPDSTREYDLTCGICLDIIFDAYGLSCGHLFCKSCACSAASILVFQGVRSASREAKCPICRQAGVYANAVHMQELNRLIRKIHKEQRKERLTI